MAMSRALLRRTALVLGLALFASYAYFYQAGGWNQNTRFALVRAVIEQHTIRIDRYADVTGDRSLWEGHYYSDKAPGASFIAVPPVIAARAVARLRGVDPESLAGVTWTSYVATLATSALFTVIAALCIYWLTLRWGASRGAALFAATAYGLATPAWAYATVFVGHSVTSGLLMGAFAAAVALPDDGSRRTLLALVLALGFDTYKDDPISVLRLDFDAYRDVGRRVRQLGLPTVVVQEGGYMVEAIGPGGAVLTMAGTESAPVVHGGGAEHELVAPAP